MAGQFRCAIPVEIATCMGESRLATEREFTALAERIRQDLFGSGSGRSIGLEQVLVSLRIAHGALYGVRLCRLPIDKIAIEQCSTGRNPLADP